MSSCSRCTYTRTISVEWGEFDDVFKYLLDREYSAGLNKVARALRQKAQSFAVDDGVLFHRNGENLCRVVVELNERDRIVQSLHADPVGGGHYGQTATIIKVTDRFWWCNVTSDTREYVRTCGVCQKANPLNRPPPASLHPVAVGGLFYPCGINSTTDSICPTGRLLLYCYIPSAGPDTYKLLCTIAVRCKQLKKVDVGFSTV